MSKLLIVVILLFFTHIYAYANNKKSSIKANIPSSVGKNLDVKKKDALLQDTIKSSKKDILIKETKILRFSSIKSNEANARKGPGLNYPIIWIFVAKHEPLAIISEFNEWRQILDISGNISWIHSSILSPKRYVITLGKDVHKLHKFASEKSRVIANVEPNVSCLLKKIGTKACKVNCNNYTGWLDKKALWGLLEGE